MGSAVCFSQGLHGLFGGPQQLLASRVVCFSRVRRAGPMLLFASWPDASNQCFLPRSFRWPSPVAQGSWFQSPVLYIEKRERRPPLLAGGCFFVTMTSNLLAALKSNQGKTSTTAVYPLIEAAKSGQVEGCSKALEDKKVKVDQKDPEGVNALMHAASGGYIQVVQFLVEKGARISAKDDMGETALMKACKEGHTDIIKFLVEAQAAQRKKGPSLTGGKDEAQASLMREKKRILDMKDDEGVTAIMKAAEQGEGDVVQILADDGASLDLKDDEGWDTLMWASLSGHFEICELLVSTFGMTADYATEKGETALMKAAANGHWDVCEFLITEGAKVNQLDQHHQTALMWAASEGHLATVQGLVKKDAKVPLGLTWTWANL
ncbi:unnamed protein product [Effrenium voratum]|nr:unnamed protein product [Effrenium voratum]